MVEKVLTLDVDATLLRANGDGLLPGTLTLLSKVNDLGLSVVVWTVADEDRIASLEKAVRGSGIRAAMGVIDTARKYSRGDRLPGQIDSPVMEKSRKLYSRGIKVPTAIAPTGSISATVDDDEEIGRYANSLGFLYIDPTKGRPEGDNFVQANNWADSIICQLIAHFEN